MSMNAWTAHATQMQSAPTHRDHFRVDATQVILVTVSFAQVREINFSTSSASFQYPTFVYNALQKIKTLGWYFF